MCVWYEMLNVMLQKLVLNAEIFLWKVFGTSQYFDKQYLRHTTVFGNHKKYV